jgi:hypothetical protein
MSDLTLFEVGTPIDFGDSDWSKRAADKLLHTIHQQRNPLLQRRLVATFLLKVAIDAVEKAAEEME